MRHSRRENSKLRECFVVSGIILDGGCQWIHTEHDGLSNLSPCSFYTAFHINDLIAIDTMGFDRQALSFAPRMTHFEAKITLFPLTPRILPVKIEVSSLLIILGDGLGVMCALEPG